MTTRSWRGLAAAPATTAISELAPGTPIAAGFRIVRRLGAGGMGIVYSDHAPAAAMIALLTARHHFARLPGDHDEALAVVALNVGNIWYALDAPARALDEEALALRLYHQAGLDDSSDVAVLLGNRGLALTELDRCREAIDDFDRAIAISRKLAPDRHEWVSSVINATECRRKRARPVRRVRPSTRRSPRSITCRHPT